MTIALETNTIVFVFLAHFDNRLIIWFLIKPAMVSAFTHSDLLSTPAFYVYYLPNEESFL